MCRTYFFSSFEVLWINRYPIGAFLTGTDFSHTQLNDVNFINTFYKEAENYDLPESEDDKEASDALEPFLNMTDQYTSIYVYGMEDGLYRAGKAAQIMYDNDFRTFFDLGYRMTNGEEKISMFFRLSSEMAVHSSWCIIISAQCSPTHI